MFQKKVNVVLDPAEVVLAVPKLLSAIPNVSISVTSDFLDAFPSLRDVLQVRRIDYILLFFYRSSVLSHFPI